MAINALEKTNNNALLIYNIFNIVILLTNVDVHHLLEMKSNITDTKNGSGVEILTKHIYNQS